MFSTPNVNKSWNQIVYQYTIHKLKISDTFCSNISPLRSSCGCDRMVVEFTTTYAISAYHH